MDEEIKKDNADHETKILREYKQPVIKILKDLAEHRQLSKVCKENLNGMQPGRLTELHTGVRELTPFYLGKLIQGDIVTIEQILQGKKIEDLPADDQIVFQRLAMSEKFIKLFGKYQAKGKLPLLEKIMEAHIEE